MQSLGLHEWHQALGATFGEVNGQEVVCHYGDASKEYTALRNTVAFMDLSYRSRLCVTGDDRARFLNGQVTNNVVALRPGQGCYAALVTAKGKMESDLHVYCLTDEFLLEFEPGLSDRVQTRLEKHIVADDVEIVNIAPDYGLLSLQGPKSAAVLASIKFVNLPPHTSYDSVTVTHPEAGEVVVSCHDRAGACGFDLFVRQTALRHVAEALLDQVRRAGGGVCGWEAMEVARVETGLPRYGQDMDDTTIPLEAGLEQRAIRYNKGCYIGQEVINRIHSVGRVTKSLRGFLFPAGLSDLPRSGDILFSQGKPVGRITSARRSPALNRIIAMGYIRREVQEQRTPITLARATGEIPVEIVDLPFDSVLAGNTP